MAPARRRGLRPNARNKRVAETFGAAQAERLLAALDAVVAESPDALNLLFARAQVLLRLGRIGAAEEAFRAVLALDRRHFRALNDLGLLYYRYRHPKEAEVLLRAAVQAEPNNPIGLANLAQVLFDRGDFFGAKDAFERALEARPEHVPALVGLKDVYKRLGLDGSHLTLPAKVASIGLAAATDADPFTEYAYDVVASSIVRGENAAVRSLLVRLAAGDSRYVMLLWRLADFAAREYKLEAALEIYRLAVSIDPQNRELQIGLATTLEELGDGDAAKALWTSDLLRGAVRVFPYTGSGTPVRLLTIASALHSIRFELFVDPAEIQNTVVYTQAYDETQPLPEHDVVLCAVADVESDAAALAVAQRIVARTSAPVLNEPEIVLHTSREEQSCRLASIENVATAHIVTASRAELCAAGAASFVRELGFAFPLLLRSPGFHNGYYFDKVERDGDLAPVAEKLPTDDIYVISFQDTTSPDGMVRKYRMMTIDGKLYPIHLAVSPQWKVHYNSSAMHDSAAFREEEARFLNDPEGYLGSRAIRALEAIAAETKLDYGGIDFGLDAEGRIRLFESNGAMGIFMPDDDPRWDYRRPAFRSALDAAKKMIVERAAQNAAVLTRS